MNNAMQQKTWEHYAAVWKTSPDAEKVSALQSCVNADCMYRDPLITTRGHAELICYISEFHKQIPGGHFVTTYYQAHNGRSMARWNMVDANGNVIGDGISFGEYNAGGMLTSMTGFFEPPKAAA